MTMFTTKGPPVGIANFDFTWRQWLHDLYNNSQLKDVTITGDLTVTGNITAVNGTFSGDVTITDDLTADDITCNDLFFSGMVRSVTSIDFGSAIAATQARFYANTAHGAVITGYGTSYDFSVINKDGSFAIRVPTGTTEVELKHIEQYSIGSGNNAMTLDGWPWLMWNNASIINIGGYNSSQWTQVRIYASAVKQLQVESDRVTIQGHLVSTGGATIAQSGNGADGYSFRTLSSSTSGLKFANYGNSVEWARFTAGGALLIGHTSLLAAEYLRVNAYCFIGDGTCDFTAGGVSGSNVWMGSFTNHPVILRVNNTEMGQLKTVGIQSEASLILKDAISAPSTIAGYCSIYVDSSDGDLKAKFGDGTVAVLADDSGSTGGDFVHISTTTASASSSIDITSGIDGTYDIYELRFYNLRPGTGNTSLYLRCTTNGGSSWDASGLGYSNQYHISDGTSGVNGSTSTGEMMFGAATMASGSSGHGYTGTIRFYRPSSTSVYKVFEGTGMYYQDGGDDIISVRFAGSRQGTAAINGIRFIMSSGTIAAGSVALYGVKTS